MSDLSLEQSLSDLLLWVETTAESTQGLVLEQAPLYVQELVAWHIWSNGLIALGCVLLAVLLAVPGVLLVRKGQRALQDPNRKVDLEDYFIPGGTLLLVSLVLLITVGHAGHEIVKGVVAPRVVVVEHLREILR